MAENGKELILQALGEARPQAPYMKCRVRLKIGIVMSINIENGM